MTLSFESLDSNTKTVEVFFLVGWLVGWFLLSVGEIWMVLYSNHKSSFVVGPEITYPLSLSTPGWVG